MRVRLFRLTTTGPRRPSLRGRSVDGLTSEIRVLLKIEDYDGISIGKMEVEKASMGVALLDLAETALRIAKQTLSVS